MENHTNTSFSFNFVNKEEATKKLYDTTIKVFFNDKIYEFYYYRMVLVPYPKIIAEIENNVWNIKKYNPSIVKLFIYDIYRSFIKLSINEVNSKNLIELHKMSIEYDCDNLRQLYEINFQKTKLDLELYNYFIEISFPMKLIANPYLNNNHLNLNILIKLIEKFDIEIWKIIVSSPRINSIRMLWVYILRYVPLNDMDIIFLLYNNRKISIDDIKYMATTGCMYDDIYLKKMVITSNYIFKRIITTSDNIKNNEKIPDLIDEQNKIKKQKI